MNEENQYKIIKSRGLANALQFISQRNYYTYKSVESDEREVYSFLDDNEFNELLSDVMELCKKYRK